MRNKFFITAIIALLTMSSNCFAEEHHHHGNLNDDRSEPIIKIMQGMNDNLSKLSSGIMLEDYEIITLSAHNIANHPSINQHDLEALFARLSDKKEDFIKCDMAVHHLAVDIAMAGKAKDMQKVLEKYSAMVAKATECHQKYR